MDRYCNRKLLIRLYSWLLQSRDNYYVNWSGGDRKSVLVFEIKSLKCRVELGIVRGTRVHNRGIQEYFYIDGDSNLITSVLEVDVKFGHKRLRLLWPKTYNELIMNVFNSTPYPFAKNCNELYEKFFEYLTKTIEGYSDLTIHGKSVEDKVKEELEGKGLWDLYLNKGRYLLKREPWLEELGKNTILHVRPDLSKTFVTGQGASQHLLVETDIETGQTRSCTIDPDGIRVLGWSSLDLVLPEWADVLEQDLVKKLERSVEEGLDYVEWF